MNGLGIERSHIRFGCLSNLHQSARHCPIISLNAFGDFLEKRFVSKELEVTHFLQNAGRELIETDIEILELEVKLFLYRVIHLNMQAFHLKSDEILEQHFQGFNKNSLS